MEERAVSEVPEGPREYRIPEARWADLEAKFEKLARRARKLGVGEVGFKIERVERAQQIRKHDNDPLAEARYREIGESDAIPEGWFLVGWNSYRIVSVSGDRPKLNGWKFVGTLQNLRDEAGQSLMILRNVPGEVIPAKYRAAEQWCDQCKTRRYRIDTYVVVHEDGRSAQVGSDCLKDFLGHQSPEAVARFCEYLMELDALLGSEEGGGSGGRGEGALYVPYVLALAAARVRVKGWMSRSKAREINGEAESYNREVEDNLVARENGEALADGAKVGYKRGVEATADAVSLYLDKQKGDREMARDGVHIEAVDEAESEAALEWIRAENRVDLQRRADEGSDYMWNLYAACLRNDMSLRTLGIVASLIAAYQRHIGRERERKERNARWANSQFVGTVKVREVFRVKMTEEPKHYANDFGGSYLTRLEDEAGNQIVWWASNRLAREVKDENGVIWENVEVGEWIDLKATVVKHEERNGVKQTTVNRAAIDVPKPPKVKKEKKA
jgi:hypothetical protein